MDGAGEGTTRIRTSSEVLNGSNGEDGVDDVGNAKESDNDDGARNEDEDPF